MNDPLSSPLTFNDERFVFLTRIVYWLEAWQSLPEKGGKLSKQTFTSLRHSCLALPEITNFLTENCGYTYLLTSFLQTDPLEHHFGLYRMMSGANYHISYLQILESKRRLKVSNILNLFSKQTVSSTTCLQESFSSIESTDCNIEIDLDPFLNTISDLSTIECDILVLQSLAFIAGYSIHRYFKCSQPCLICRDILTLEKDLFIDDMSLSQFKLLDLSDRGSLKYPSEMVLECIVIVWKIFVNIENDDELLILLIEGPSRKILIELSVYYIMASEHCNLWNKACSSCAASGYYILQKLISVAVNCFLANKVKNYNSLVVAKGVEKRKLKKFNK